MNKRPATARRSRPGDLAPAFGWALAWILAFVLPAAAPAQTLITNSGGVLLLSIPSDEPFQADSTRDLCLSLKPLLRSEIRTRLPIDGVPRLVVVYTEFPQDSTAFLSAFSFGIQYSKTIKVVDQGRCSNVGYELADSLWPASGTGKVAICQPPQMIAPGFLLPVHWFVLAASAPGFFELTPHPNAVWGGRFANADPHPYQESITGYGRIGAGLEGFAPQAGRQVARGACCLDRCYLSSDYECGLYKGLFLGAGTDCDDSPCGPAALRGGCCLPTGCEMLTLVQCANRGGLPLGEAITCGEVPCSEAALGARRAKSRIRTPEWLPPPGAAGDTTGAAGDTTATGDQENGREKD